jgi:hypothetical protein
MPRRRLGRLPGILSHHHLLHPLLGLLAGCYSPIALLLSLLAAVPLDRQFVLHPLKSLFDNLLLADRTLERLIPGEPLMGQFGLEVADRRLHLLEPMFRVLSRGDLLVQSLSRCVELVGAGAVILIPVDHRDTNLAITDETPTLWM